MEESVNLGSLDVNYLRGYKRGMQDSMEIVNEFYVDEEAQGNNYTLPILQEIYKTLQIIVQPVNLCPNCGAYEVERPDKVCLSCKEKSSPAS